MTHEQLAWTFGYPAYYGTPMSLNRLRTWRYDNLPPFNCWVTFDSNGRVTKFGTDGRLP